MPPRLSSCHGHRPLPFGREPRRLDRRAAKQARDPAPRRGRRGCSGFQYRFGLADAPENDDTIVETDGVKLVVDSVSLDLVRGCVVDFVDNLGGSAFKVENPNATAGCGCGTSFSV